MDAQVTTFSEMSTFSICRQRWFYDYVKKIKPKVTPKPLYLGSLIHAAQGFYYNGKLSGAVPPLEAVKDFFITQADKQYAAICEMYPEMKERVTDLKGSVELGTAMIDGWVRFIAKYDELMIEKITTTAGVELHPVEIFGNVPILTPAGNPSTKFRFGFKCDTLVKYHGKWFLRESKTAKAWSEKDLLSIQRDPQILGYAWGFEQMSGFEIAGVIYDVIIKSAIKMRDTVPDLDAQGKKIVIDGQGNRVFKKDGMPRESPDKEKGFALRTHQESRQEFMARMIAEYTSYPTEYFKRHILYLDRELVKERGRIMWEMSKDMADPFVYQTSSQWNTCRMGCRFLDLCNSRTKEEREACEAMYFVQKKAKHEELEQQEDDD